ncbi:MAG: hypothetical protein OEX07_03325 [Gammaproteobacteria bacterium]|nr:hypothetical protein [Gammaproteobacteria bacterium]
MSSLNKSVCSDCTRANVDCPAWPSYSSTCIEKIPAKSGAAVVHRIYQGRGSDKKIVPVDELFSDVLNPPYPLKNCESSEWHHMQCSLCIKWWAIEGPLLQSKFNCPHCGAVNEKPKKEKSNTEEHF